MVLLGGWAAQAQSEMGLLIGGGAGTFNYKFQKDIPIPTGNLLSAE